MVEVSISCFFFSKQNLDLYYKAAIERFRIKNNGAPPLQLFYYRDGVSDSEFDTVYQQEYKAIAGLFPRVLHYILHTQNPPDAYHQAGIQQFECMFLYVTKR